MKGRTRYGKFVGTGSDVNLILGFIPSYFRITNFNATDTEVAVIEWWKEMGDDVAVHWINSDAGEANFLAKSSGGLIAEYDTNAITTGTTVSVGGGKGVTIGAAFMDDSDVLYYEAYLSDRDVDHGDAANF